MTGGSLWAEGKEAGQMEGPKNPKTTSELRESAPAPGTPVLHQELLFFPLFR